MDQGFEGPTGYIHITQNEFSYRKHKKQKEEDIAICECKLDLSFPDTACGERCLNALTNTECTPGYCPSSTYCKNQKFQRCEYVKTRLFRTAGRGWGLLADQNIKAGDFVTEYCGEVISWREAKKRAQAYEIQGITDAYMIALNAFESIDATRKGSLARFINHSCEPNCETRKWTVLGENRVGIFAKQDISVGTELSYDYNFEWYGGAKIRCLCGGINCSGFLGAKSRGFQEDTYLWEDDDDRFSVEKIPLYDSAEDEAPESVLVTADSTKSGSNDAGRSDHSSVEGSYALPDREAVLAGKDPVISQLNNSQKKKVKPLPKGRVKNLNPKEVDARLVASLLAEKEAQEEVLNFEGIRIDASSNLESVYNEIRPTIEEHERDNQDSVPTSLAVKWIEACCYKSKAEFDLYCSIMKNIVCAPKRKRSDIEPAGVNENEVKLMTNG